MILARVRLDTFTGDTLVRRGALSMVGVVLQGSTRFLTNLAIGRIGGPVALGVTASAVATSQFLALLWPTSTGSAASKFVARARGARDLVETAAVASHLGRRTLQTGFLLAVLAVPLWMRLDHGTLSQALIVAALVLTYSGYSFTRGLHFGAAQIGRATFWDVISSTVAVIGVVCALLAGARGLHLLLPVAGASLLYTVACWPWGARGPLRAELRREMDGFVALATLGTMCSAGLLQLSMIAARLVSGTTGAGQYAAALALATPLSIVAGSLSLVLYPSMSSAYGRGDHESFRRQTDGATRALALVMVAVFGSIALCSDILISFVWGSRYAQAAEIMPLLVIAVLATTLAVPSLNSLTSRGQHGMKVATLASATGLAVAILVTLLTYSSIGLSAVATGYLSGTLTTSAIAISTTWHNESQRWTGLMLRIATAAGLLVTLVLIQFSVSPSFWLQISLALAYCLAWIALSFTDLLLTKRLVFGARVANR